MNKLAIVLGLSLIAVVFTTGNAYASGWDKDPYYVNQDVKVNTSVTPDFDKRQTHVKGWHGSPVCGLELCDKITGTETLKYQGLTVGGAKPDVGTPHNGHYYIKGTFGIYTETIKEVPKVTLPEIPRTNDNLGITNPDTNSTNTNSTNSTGN